MRSFPFLLGLSAGVAAKSALGQEWVWAGCAYLVFVLVWALEGVVLR